MRSLALLAGCVLALLSAAACSDAPSPVLPDVPSRSSGTLSVYFVGPNGGDPAPGQICMWQALVNGGTAPYSYSWSYNNMAEDWSFGDYWGGHTLSTGWYSLTVQVTDAVGRTGSRTYSGNSGLYENANCG